MSADRGTITPAEIDNGLPVDLSADGVLFMINVVLFHPRGYALGVDSETRSNFVLLGDGTERWSFAEGDHPTETAHSDELWAAFHALLNRAATRPPPTITEALEETP